MDKYSKTLEYHEKYHKIFDIAIAKNHLDLAPSYNNVASFYYKMNEYSNTWNLFKKPLEILLEKLPSTHSHIAIVIRSIEFVKQEMYSHFHVYIFCLTFPSITFHHRFLCFLLSSISARPRNFVAFAIPSSHLLTRVGPGNL